MSTVSRFFGTLLIAPALPLPNHKDGGRDSELDRHECNTGLSSANIAYVDKFMRSGATALIAYWT